jgi:uncharacterized membrane protein
MKRYLIAGLLVWVPLGVTFMVIKFLVDLLDKSMLLIPPSYRPEALLGMHIPGLGVVISAIIVLSTGMFVAHFFGNKLIAVWERFLARIPLVRTIYISVKQLLETIFSSTGQSFRKVLLIEYPRRGVWTLALQASADAGEAQARTGMEVINVFVPTTPNPTSGFFLIVPKKDVIELDMSVDDGLKMIMSAGVVVPKWKDRSPELTGSPGPGV